MSVAPSIKKLDEAVINRIAAGEVIQRPYNALKELIENSIDAKSSKIQITVKDGGLKLLQISDNGTGIRKEDLDIVCERFTTSKLSKFEDLTKISTYGFRGEALASISHVAHLTIVTKTADNQCGYKASYVDSKLKNPPKPCAVEKGTQIIVEELFYNVPTRKNALKSPAEEYSKVLDVVRKYAIHNSKIAFSLKKHKETLSDVNTPQNSTSVDNIRLIYGASIAKELLEVKDSDDTLKFQVQGQITNVNYSNKKFTFLLFINDRLVNSSSLKSIIEQVYSIYLPKNNYPFVYLSLTICPENIDVNVHPTKHEVHFLHEENIVNKIKAIFEKTLLGSNTSRIFYTQSKLPAAIGGKSLDAKVEESDSSKIYAHKTVRTDCLDQKLDKFFHEKSNDTQSDSEVVNNQNSKPIEKREIKLRSILQLKADVENASHSGLANIIKNFVVVGFINTKQCLLQYDTKLYLCNTENLVKELIYQTMLLNFANFGVLRFSNPLSIKELVLFYFELNEGKWTETDGTKDEISNNMTSLLCEKSDMLEDYFSIEIDNEGNICTLPIILEKYIPNLALLPDFVVRICSEVDWDLEKPCLEGICREISQFYCKIPEEVPIPGFNEWKWTTEHVLLSEMRSSLQPPKKFMKDGTILEIANLPDLYKVFERC
ncbi:DNA mismatch repair protein MlH1, putative [Pediculus humanus corporis]|uniref:DNA mismatch repair protein MLH1 n=1 Tax=Pediculus humanus subsp. corporis TaxID=121224 RepID=E0VGD0_PEDHC|nr:DNA mismatch repair protein MlH1, putative [Pediculus humanus corporis]EEB12436.1 DNA mismatch repair protein MlH1, putative [Pediculus humanus corporis]